MLDEYKSEIKDLKALTMAPYSEIKDLKALTMAPYDDSKQEVTSEKQPEPEDRTTESQSKPKKWWKF